MCVLFFLIPFVERVHGMACTDAFTCSNKLFITCFVNFSASHRSCHDGDADDDAVDGGLRNAIACIHHYSNKLHKQKTACSAVALIIGSALCSSQALCVYFFLLLFLLCAPAVLMIVCLCVCCVLDNHHHLYMYILHVVGCSRFFFSLLHKPYTIYR